MPYVGGEAGTPVVENPMATGAAANRAVVTSVKDVQPFTWKLTEKKKKERKTKKISF